MPVAQSPAHYINSSKGFPYITESFPLCFLLEHKMSLSPLASVATTLLNCAPAVGMTVAVKKVEFDLTGRRRKNGPRKKVLKGRSTLGLLFEQLIIRIFEK
jgi:hypothetical protein